MTKVANDKRVIVIHIWLSPKEIEELKKWNGHAERIKRALVNNQIPDSIAGVVAKSFKKTVEAVKNF